MKLTKVEKEVLNVLEQRRIKGRKEYGAGIRTPHTNGILGWLNEAIEECADQLTYLVAMKELIKQKELK